MPINQGLLADSSSRRKKNFGVRVTAIRKHLDPEPGEFAVHVTYNGFQEYVLTFTPDEWLKVRAEVEQFFAKKSKR